MREPALEGAELAIGYPGSPIARGISFTLEPGSLTALMGPNGAGKSTLIKSLLGLAAVDEGTVTFFGRRLHRVRPRVAYVPQRTGVDLDFPITARDVVLLGTYPKRGFGRRVRHRDREAASRALQQMGLAQLADTRIGDLSGGQLQRVFVARALAQEADLFILDEPLTGVDHSSERVIIEQLRALAASGSTVLAVHHDLSTAQRYFDRILLLDRALLADGPSSSVVESHHWSDVFGVRTEPK